MKSARAARRRSPSSFLPWLRQLARNALEERRKNRPPHAFRELFRELRVLLAEPGESGDDDDRIDAVDDRAS